MKAIYRTHKRYMAILDTGEQYPLVDSVLGGIALKSRKFMCSITMERPLRWKAIAGGI